MGGVDEVAFVQTTFDTYKNQNLERAVEETEKRARQFKSLAESENMFVLATVWLFALVLLFFVVPIFLTGFLTKGAYKRDQATYWVAILLIVSLLIFKAYLF